MIRNVQPWIWDQNHGPVYCTKSKAKFWEIIWEVHDMNATISGFHASPIEAQAFVVSLGN